MGETATKQHLTPSGIYLRKGQIWKDSDPRITDRLLRFEYLYGGSYARFTVLKSGKLTTVAIKRLKPGSSGYECVNA